MEVSAGGPRLGVLHSPGVEPKGMISGVGRNGHEWRGERSEVGVHRRVRAPGEVGRAQFLHEDLES